MTIEDKNKILYELELIESDIEITLENMAKGIMDGVSLNLSLNKLVEIKELIANGTD